MKGTVGAEASVWQNCTKKNTYDYIKNTKYTGAQLEKNSWHNY